MNHPWDSWRASMPSFQRAAALKCLSSGCTDRLMPRKMATIKCLCCLLLNNVFICLKIRDTERCRARSSLHCFTPSNGHSSQEPGTLYKSLPWVPGTQKLSLSSSASQGVLAEHSAESMTAGPQTGAQISNVTIAGRGLAPCCHNASPFTVF